MDFKKSNRDLEISKVLEAEKNISEVIKKLKIFQEAIKEGEALSHVINYISSRGFTEEQARHFIYKYKLGYDNAHNSLIIPLQKGYIYRSINGNSKGNFGEVEIINKEALSNTTVFICEGFFDMLSLEALKINAISTNSINNIEKLKELIRENKEFQAKNYIIALDNDTEGAKARESLSSFFKELKIAHTMLELPSGDKEAKKDINILYKSNLELLEANIKQAKEYFFPSMLQAQSSMLELSKSNKGITKFKTGYKFLDDMLLGGLQEGELTILGAESSIGKTTFMLNIADNVAIERPVLYFTIEQSKHELYCKLLSKEYYSTNKDTKDCTLRDRMNKKYGSMRDFQNMINISSMEYEKIQELRSGKDNRIFLLEGNFALDVNTIKAEIEKFISLFAKVPLVVIDYLQIIKPPLESRLTEKQVLDYNITTLRQISRNTKAHIICISSLNRASYSKKAGLEALKESGGLEYTADNVMLMYPFEVIAGEEAGAETYKSKATKQAGLKLLKQRAGLIRKEPLLFEFIGNYSYFEEKKFYYENENKESPMQIACTEEIKKVKKMFD